MLVKLTLGLAALLAIILALRWFSRAPTQDAARALRRLALYSAAALLLFLAATGRLHWLFASLAALVAMLPRLIWYVPLLGGLYKRYKAARSTQRGPAPGQFSQVETRFVRMSLNHDSGDVDGIVLDGAYKGARLSELSIDQLIELLGECRINDHESAQLVQAFLDKVHGDAWRDRDDNRQTQGGAAPTGGGPMNPTEAYEILGLESGASEAEIVAAHRRLMQKLHPDRGGTGYLAAKINQAKDLLLGARRSA